MPQKVFPVINIALVGGGSYCAEFIKKTMRDYRQNDVNARLQAIADPDPTSPGMQYAKQFGLKTISDYHDLYDPQLGIDLIIILTPEQEILKDILETKPRRIRILSYEVFDMVWKAIGVEERKLRSRSKEIETILNGIQEVITVITPDLEIVGVNDAFLKQMHCLRKEVIGKKCYQVFQNSSQRCDDKEIACPLTDVIRNKRSVTHIMTRKYPSGKQRHFEISIYPIWEDNGKIAKFVDISRDITVRLREEEEITRRLEHMVEERTRELEETHNKLLHQDKIASLGKLAASVVHEINNPIAGILNLIILIKRIIGEGPLTQKAMEQFVRYLDLMETETRRTSEIVSGLLAFSRQSKIELQKLSLNRLIEQTLFLNLNLLKITGVRVEKDLEPNLPELVGSANQIEQVFMNLISNAVEAMELTGGGVLRIETRHSLKDAKINVKFTDTGVGIPQEDLPKVFEPFFTTKKNGKGVGLGLSVVYGIIQEHGGLISVKSKVGSGSTFEIEFPIKGPPMHPEQVGESHGQY